MSITQLILSHINILWHYVKMIPILYKIKEIFGVIVHMNVDRAIFLLFHDDQDTKSDYF